LVNGERILRIGLKDFGYWPNCLGIDDIPGEITISHPIPGNILDANADHRFGNSKEKEEVAVEEETKTTGQDNSEGGDATQGENAHDQSD